MNTDSTKLSRSAMDKIKRDISKNKQSAIKIGGVDDNEVAMLKSIGVLDTPNEHVVTTNGVKHILKTHGQGATLRPNEVAVTMNDIEMIPSIINNPDRRYPSIKLTNREKRPAIVYEKQVGNKYYYVESFNNENGNLETQTMYINL